MVKKWQHIIHLHSGGRGFHRAAGQIVSTAIHNTNYNHYTFNLGMCCVFLNILQKSFSCEVVNSTIKPNFNMNTSFTFSELGKFVSFCMKCEQGESYLTEPCVIVDCNVFMTSSQLHRFSLLSLIIQLFKLFPKFTVTF